METRNLTKGLPNAIFSIGDSCLQSSQQLDKEHSWPRGFLLRYELESIIGNGASSEVFAARSKKNGESVAVKRIFKTRCCVGTRATRRLRDEVRVLSKLKHPNIIEMREVWETPTELYIVMERALGGELFDRIIERGNFCEKEAKIVMRQLLFALSEMHRQGVIHRDVKPENLLLQTRTGWNIKLSDFGLVKTLEDEDALLQNYEIISKNTEILSGDIAIYPTTREKINTTDNDNIHEQNTQKINQKRPRRPSWGEALETVDEGRPAHYSPAKPRLSEDTNDTTDVQYYFSTAGVDVKLCGGPIVAELPQSVELHALRAIPPPPPHEQIQQEEFQQKKYLLSEEEAFALLPTLPLPRTSERDMALLFHRARTHTLCGSQFYMAPEVCNREKYGPAVDIWSAGVVMYILLTGSPPWDRPPQFGVTPELDIHGDLAQVSHLGVDLLLRMLRGIPEQRCTAAEALAHPWLIQHPDAEQNISFEQQRGLSPHFESAIRNFCEKRKRANLYTNLDTTPISNNQYNPPNTGPAVDLKRNRHESVPTTLREGVDRSSLQLSEYDTFSSEHDSEEEEEEDISPLAAALHLNRPPYNGQPISFQNNYSSTAKHQQTDLPFRFVTPDDRPQSRDEN
mmetsp:Transcript_9916/g.13742  ORF Transcript_9916/g.13742 Transcript_9916/m.13742 type:complete len:626 (+) Transcript_9916:65-1942(+)